MCARVFDVGVWNPRKHLFALREHLLDPRVEIGKHLDRHASVSHYGRKSLSDPFVFLVLFLRTQPLSRSNELPNGRVSSNERWISGLSIDKAEQGFDSSCFFGIAPIYQDLGLRSVCQHIGSLK